MTNGSNGSQCVVVGVSPTTGSPAALRWAADEARLRGCTLLAVMAWRAPRPPAAPGGRPPAVPSVVDDDLERAEVRLRGFVVDALGAEAAVGSAVVRGSAVNALRSAARNAALVVIGEPRRGRFSTVRTSLVAPQLVLKAGCPVVVMPAATP